MSYINQFIKESQLKYSTVFQTPFAVLSHLFFSGGNGYIVENGNPHEIIEWNKKIPFTQFYADEKPFEEMKKFHYEMYGQFEIEDTFQKMKDTKFKYGVRITDDLEQELWRLARKDYFTPINKLVNIDKYPIKLDRDYWMEQILMSRYANILSITNTSLCWEFNSNTEIKFRKLLGSVVETLIFYYENFDEYKVGKFNPFKPRTLISNELESYVSGDLEKLKKIHERII